MSSDAVKLAKLQHKDMQLQTVKEILTNRAVLMMIGFVLTEYLQTVEVSRKVDHHTFGGDETTIQYLMPSKAGSLLEFGLIVNTVAPLLSQGMMSSEAVTTKLLDKTGDMVKGAGLLAALGV